MMIKKIVATLTAFMIFLSASNFALAKKKFEVDEPFEATETEDVQSPPENFATESQPYEPFESSPPPAAEVEGLEFLIYNRDGVMAFAIIADHEKYQMRPVLARGQVPGRATVSQMNAPDAIATINASYFGTNGTLYGNTKIDGVTAGTTYYIRSAMGIRADGTVIFARQVYRGVLQFNGEEVVVDGVDCERNRSSFKTASSRISFATRATITFRRTAS